MTTGSTTSTGVSIGAASGTSSTTPVRVNVKQFGALGDGVSDDSAAILAASATGAYVEFSAGTYLVNQSIVPTSMLWYSNDGAVIKIPTSVNISAGWCAVDVSGITFNGTMTAAQYTPAIMGAQIVTAFSSMTFLNAAGTSYAGADFTHTITGNQLTLSLASLTSTNRSVVSGMIAVTPANRYVVHVLAGILAQTGNFAGIQINTYNSGGTLLGVYSPAASQEDLSLTGASQIAIQINLQNSAKTSTTNGTTIINLDHLAFFQLVNEAASSNLSANTSYAIGLVQCVRPRIANCRFTYHPRQAIQLISCNSSFLTGNTITKCWQAFGDNSSTNTVIRGNVVDLSQLSTDGNSYNLKFLRHHCVSATTAPGLMVIGNTLLGANWAVEAVPQTGDETIITDNTIQAEISGISVHDGLNSRIAHNDIDLAPGWNLMGVELPGTHVNMSCVYNTINVPDSLLMDSRAISLSIYTANWVGGTISHNKLAGNTAVFASSVVTDVPTSLVIEANTIEYSAAGIFTQYIGAQYIGNTLRRTGDSFVSYIPNTSMAVYAIGSQNVTITGNVADSGPEGVLSITNITNVVKDNVFNLLSVLPVAVSSTASGSQDLARNTFTGTAPTAYFAGSGNPSRSKDNRHVNGTLVLLGTIDEHLSVETSPRNYGAKGDGVTDDSAAFTLAINDALANYPKALYIPAGVYLINAALPAITRPITIYGEGKRSSILQFGTGVAGACLNFVNVGFNNESTDFPQTGSTAWTSLASVSAGLALKDFSIQGNRSAASQQHGLVFQGNCDHVSVERIEATYFRGRAIWIGKQTGSGGSAIRGYMRESYFNDIKIRHSGDTDTTASFGLYLNDTPGGSADSSNLNRFENIDVIFSYGKGFEVADQRTTDDGTSIYGTTFRNILLHERYAGITAATGRLLSVTGAVNNCFFDCNFAFCSNNDYCTEILRNTTTNNIPYDNTFEHFMPNVKKGVYMTAVGPQTFKYKSYYAPGEALYTTSAAPGALKIECETDNAFIQTTASFTLNGVNPVAISIGVFNTSNALKSFFPIIAANGTGDTTKAMIFGGITGTITRAGSTTGGTDTYTFTPDTSSTTTIPNGEYFSKFIVSANQANTVSGRYKYIPENRYGIASNSYWASNRLLSMAPWQFHVESASTLPRMTYGTPTADNNGTPLALWKSAFIGVTATPNVAGLSKLVANYASATTVTDLTNGDDGQTLKIIATGTTTTIANNSRIKTTTGANITMSDGQVLTFTYDSSRSQWCGG